MDVLDTVDQNSMRSMIEAFPYLLNTIHIESNVLEKVKEIATSSFNGIALLGMGGSAIAGDICKEVLIEKGSVPIVSIRDYSLPSFVDKSWIIIAVSYSGNTEETLSSFHESVRRKCQIFTITSGGQLGDLTEDNCLCRLPKGFQPRAAFPLILALEIYLLETLLGIVPSDMKNISEHLQKISIDWKVSNTTPIRIAEKVIGKIPLIIGWQHTAPVAYRVKCQFNENSKTAAFYSIMPEMCHNEIESSGEFSKEQIIPIFLRSTFETPEATQRFEAISRIFHDEGCAPLNLEIQCKSKLEEVLALTYFCDILTLEVAEKKKVDPTSIERITRVKRFLSKT